jgi:RecA/RadA recombinase
MTEKQKALESAISQIERQFGKGSIMKLGEAQSKFHVEVISTGALSLDVALGVGGVPRGRIVEIFGPESSGKTTVALHMVAEAQKGGGTAAFIDAEHALDPTYAKNLCVRPFNITGTLPTKLLVTSGLWTANVSEIFPCFNCSCISRFDLTVCNTSGDFISSDLETGSGNPSKKCRFDD